MHYKQLDGLRFFAVISVIFHHITPLPKIFDFDLGSFGVNLFFVISGFLITEILIRQKIKKTPLFFALKTFFVRRILRIFPLYFLYIFICFIIVPNQTSEYLNWLLTYTINIWIVVKNQLAFWYFTHLWSLSVEEQFYLFWPFLILISPIKRLKFLFILMIFFSIVFRLVATIYFSNYNLFNYTMLPTTLDCFGAGALLAYMKEFKPNQLNNLLKCNYLIFIGVILFILNNKFGTTLTQQSFGKSIIAFISFYLVGLCSTSLFVGKLKLILENKIIMYLGRISYGMYVYHLLIWGSFGKYFTDFWQYLNPITLSLSKSFFEFIFISIGTIIVSILSYELFEKQFLNLKRYILY